MYISHKNNVLQTYHDNEWECRLRAKGMDKSEYWTWLDSVTTTDSEGIKTVDYSGETGYTMVNVTDERVLPRLAQLSDYTGLGGVYNIKWSDSKEYFVMTPDLDGNPEKAVESEVLYTDEVLYTSQDKLNDELPAGKEIGDIKTPADVLPEGKAFGDVKTINYKMSHFEGDDTTKDARVLAEKWEVVREQRNRLIAETDYLALSDQTLSVKMTTYRQDLRDVPTQSDPDDISWPTKPS